MIMKLTQRVQDNGGWTGGQNNDWKGNDLAIFGTETPGLVKFDIVDLHSNTDFAVIS